MPEAHARPGDFSNDYASLADLESEMKEVMGDAGFMDIFRGQASHVVQGSSVSEILMTIDDVV